MPKCANGRVSETHRGTGWLSVAALCAGAIVGPTQPAKACSYLPFKAELATERVPPAGPVIVELWCYDAAICDRIVGGAFGVFRDGEAIAGHVRAFSREQRLARGQGHTQDPGETRVIVWIPETPLATGAGTQARIDDEEYVGHKVSLPLRVEAAARSAPPDLTRVEARLFSDEIPVGDKHCCRGPCTTNSCVTREEQLAVSMSFHVGNLGAPRATLIRTRVGDDPETASEWHIATQLPPRLFRMPSDAYCATLEALDPVADEVVAEREICLEAPFATDAVGTVRATILDDELMHRCERPFANAADDPDGSTPGGAIGRCSMAAPARQADSVTGWLVPGTALVLLRRRKRRQKWT
ncbi:MAG: hypothetical protein OXU20_38980 [Myxococcales bacterium]|nr:hypothetical protein [Myxococcales bacterium]